MTIACTLLYVAIPCILSGAFGTLVAVIAYAVAPERARDRITSIGVLCVAAIAFGAMLALAAFGTHVAASLLKGCAQ